MWKKLFKFRDSENPDEAKPFLEHLEDLRWMLTKMAITLISCMVLCFAFRKQLIDFVQAPLKKIDADLVNNLQVLGVADSIMISIQLAFFAGLIFSFPILLLFLLQFVLPGLRPNEQRVLWPALGVGAGLFLGGISLCYHFILPVSLNFLFQDAKSLDWQPQWTVREYFAFVTHFVLAFGLAFETPVVVMALVHMGLLSHSLLQRTRAYALVIILILSAIITPTPDIFTLLCLAAPIYLLYEGCIWVAWYLERRAAKAEARSLSS
ncbi:MAG: twin-arginine translocase subunit TatC [Verrucomicrobiales bacterium]